MVISQISYCNVLYGRLTRRLQYVHNAVARLVAGMSKCENITPVLTHLHWLLIVSQIRLKVLMLVYKGLHAICRSAFSQC